MEKTNSQATAAGVVDTSVVNTVCDVLADVFGVPRAELSEATTRDDIPEWDSVGHLNLALALEEAFDITFSVDDIAELTSVEAIAKKVREKCPSA